MIGVFGIGVAEPSQRLSVSNSFGPSSSQGLGGRRVARYIAKIESVARAT